MTLIQNGFSSRNAAIDILRALTMVLMVFVNDLWSISGIPSWLSHARADQDFLGLADIVFPCFLFVVGMSIPYAIENSIGKGRSGAQITGHILLRSLALLIMGLFLVNLEGGIASGNSMGYSFYQIMVIIAFMLTWNYYPKSGKRSHSIINRCLKSAGILLLIYLGIIYRNPEGDWLTPQWWGILGIIGWTYLVCAFIYFFTRDRLKYLIPIWIVFLLWNFLQCKLIATGSPILSLAQGNALDALLGTFNIGNGAHCALTMGGIILSVVDVKYRHKLKKPVIAGMGITVMLLVLGYISNHFWIISKIQATSPWVFYSSAIAVGTYTILSLLTFYGKEKWFAPIRPAGTATLTCYLLPYIIYSVLNLLNISKPEWFSTGIAGIFSCLLLSFVCIGFTYLLGKIKVRMKI